MSYRRASIGIEWFRTASWSSLGVMSGPSTRVAAAGESGTFLFIGPQSKPTFRIPATWHFVVPEDIRWLLDLTASRVRAGLASRYRELEIDDRVAARAAAAFATALAGGRYLTRPELGQALRAAGISPEGQRLPHLLLRAELDQVIVSGPRHGKQFTYARFEERVPKSPALERSEALGELTLRYFRSHGPAQVSDFTWWSGLTAAEARRA